MTDVDRVAKWKGRADEWRRLSTLAADSHIVHVCTDMAEHSDRMAHFWEKWK